nr:hypothetical protein CFP56_47690 [Quercus suber]
MEMSIRFRCCHNNQSSFNSNCCHNNTHTTKVKLKEKVSPVSLVCGMTVTAACRLSLALTPAALFHSSHLSWPKHRFTELVQSHPNLVYIHTFTYPNL